MKRKHDSTTTGELQPPSSAEFIPEDLAPFWPSESLEELQAIAAASVRYRRDDKFGRPPSVEQVQRWRYGYRRHRAEQLKEAAERRQVAEAEDLARRTCPVCREPSIELTVAAVAAAAQPTVHRELVETAHGRELVTIPTDSHPVYVPPPQIPADGQRVRLPSGQWVKACRACVVVVERELAALAAAQSLPDGRTRAEAAKAFLEGVAVQGG